MTPAKLHLGRELNTAINRFRLPVENKILESQEKQKLYFGGNRNKIFKLGDPVLVKIFGKGSNWLTGAIKKVISPVTYLVNCNLGEVKRHIDQLKPLSTWKPPSTLPNVLDGSISRDVTQGSNLNRNSDRVKFPPVLVQRPKRLIKPRNVLDL